MGFGSHTGVIVMDFADKFDYLMKLTGTHNSTLARAVAIDASLVSRWRSGKRSPVNNRAMMADLGKFFAQRLNSGYQKAELRPLLGDLYERYSGFIAYSEILALWLQGKEPAGDGLESMLLGSGLANTEKMMILLRAGLLKNTEARMWLLINLPVYKTEFILQEFLAFAAACETDGISRAEINVIMPQDVLNEIFGGTIGRILQTGSALNHNFKWYEMTSPAGVFETVAFAIEDVGGIAYSGIDFTEGGFNKVYSGGKLEQLVGMLKNFAAKCSINTADIQKNSINSFLNKFKNLNIGPDLQPNALYVSDKSGISRYIKADSRRLWGLPTEEMLGKNTAELERSGSYFPSITRMVLESGSSVCTLQTTGTGCELLVIGTPVLDAHGKIEYIVNLSSEIKNKNQGQ